MGGGEGLFGGRFWGLISVYFMSATLYLNGQRSLTGVFAVQRGRFKERRSLACNYIENG